MALLQMALSTQFRLSIFQGYAGAKNEANASMRAALQKSLKVKALCSRKKKSFTLKLVVNECFFSKPINLC